MKILRRVRGEFGFQGRRRKLKVEYHIRSKSSLGNFWYNAARKKSNGKANKKVAPNVPPLNSMNGPLCVHLCVGKSVDGRTDG